eukprot:Skav207885  [mRNA]  locus=scaffold664:548451:552944:- [translate_table: standard]
MNAMENFTGADPLLTTMQNGDKVSVRIQLVCRSDRGHLAVTWGRRQFVRTNADISLDSDHVVITNGTYEKRMDQHWIMVGNDGQVFTLPKPSYQGLTKVVEACAGFACVDEGYRAAGAETICMVEQNPRYCHWLKQKVQCPVVEADISDPALIPKLLEVIRTSHVMSGGTACQPFSRLGDRKEQGDDRSRSLPGILRTAYMLGSVLVLIECTKEAYASDWVQACIREFVQFTGFNCRQTILSLHTFWPARRDRWWAVIAHPGIVFPPLQPLPGHRFEPTIMHVCPHMLKLSATALQQLTLTQAELDLFESAVGGISNRCMDITKPCPVATHSWGSQATECPCGCRDQGFAPARIQSKGLYASVIIDKATEQVRHPDPREVSFFNGLNPSHIEGEEALRFKLSGVGQMASPFQGAWLLGNLLWHQGQAGLMEPQEHPRQILLQMCQQLLQERDQLWGTKVTPLMHIFLNELVAIVSPRVFSPPEESDEEPSTQEILRQCEQAECCEQTSVTPSGTSEEQVQVAPEGQPETNHTALVAAATQLDMEVDMQATPPASPPSSFANGGVPGFATSKACPSHAPIAQANQEAAQAAAEVIHDSDSMHGEDPDDQMLPAEVVIQVLSSGDIPAAVTCPANLTVRELLTAEAILQTDHVEQAWTILGEPCHLDDVVQPQRVYLVKEQTQSDMNTAPPALEGHTRLQLLWEQRGWVALDEMQYYMHLLDAAFPGSTHPVAMIPIDEEHAQNVGDQITQAVLQALATPQQPRRAMVFLHGGHWSPMVVQAQMVAGQVIGALIVPDEDRTWVQETIAAHVSFDIRVETCQFFAEFPADCGFQSIGWLMHILSGRVPDAPMSCFHAEQWRMQFADFLLRTGHAFTMIHEVLNLGGMRTKEQLRKLIVSHGVAEARSTDCADKLIAALGQSNVDMILRSPKPWQDLKSQTSMLKPPFRIVTAEELKTQIQARMQSEQPVGKKANKTKPRPIEPFRLQADQISIPTGVFRQEDGTELAQIKPQQLGPASKGIVVVTIDEALPYFNLNASVSSEGVGLLITDAHDPRIPNPKQIIRVPATCRATEEPMLFTAALLQLGQKAVARNVPHQIMEVQQVPNSVIRAVIYRDQLGGVDWDTFIRKPVKCILDSPPFVKEDAELILDVWDRQFLSNRLTKTTPETAHAFSVNLRLSKALAQRVMEASGNEGRFFEPRTEDGRKPLGDFQVVWLPKRSYAQAVVCQKTTTVPVSLVRNQDRYGLRALMAQAEAVHRQHRPEVQWIPGVELQRFRAGPWPFGSTKNSIVQICKKWGWNARPIGPVQQSADRSGCVWVMVASEPPSHWIYHLQHGDILISAEKDAQAATPVLAPVMASARTEQSLAKPSEPTKDRKDDPWVHRDPWQQNHTGKELSVGQMQAIEKSLEARLMEKIQQTDSPMEPVDQRMTDLEAKVESLQASVAQQQTAQQQHNQTVQQQLQQLDNKVDTQSQAFQGFLETSLAEQMRKIELLLNKRRAE